MKITIPDDYVGAARQLPSFSKVAAHEVEIWSDIVRDPTILASRLKDTEAVVLIRERTKITEQVLSGAPKLRMLTINGPCPHVDVEACTRRGVLVCASHPRQPRGAAELTWALILASMRNIPQEVQRLKSGQWQGSLGRSLRGRTLGIYGYGRIGSALAEYGKAFGMDVLVWSRERGRNAAAAAGFATIATKEELFRRSDVLTLAIRLVPETRGCITAADLASMKPGALFVNTARDGLVESGALVAGLKAGRPAFAAIDVYDEEPLTRTDHPLLQLPNAVCTPHLGFVEAEQLDDYFSDQYDRILAYASGKPVDVINPAAMNHEHFAGRWSVPVT
jgi:D-3-phosphoglycerate dehydrogenase / 2-oxoglutarate reductase